MTKKTRNKTIIFSIIGLVVCVGAAALVFLLTQGGGRVRLDEEYYGKSEILDLNKDGYEELIAQKKSFVVMTDETTCVTSKRMRERMLEMPENLHFSYYLLPWRDALASSLHDKVKFMPSIAIIKQGEVIAFLDAESDADKDAYNEPEALQAWLEQYIEF